MYTCLSTRGSDRQESGVRVLDTWIDMIRNNVPFSPPSPSPTPAGRIADLKVEITNTGCVPAGRNKQSRKETPFAIKKTEEYSFGVGTPSQSVSRESPQLEQTGPEGVRVWYTGQDPSYGQGTSLWTTTGPGWSRSGRESGSRAPGRDGGRDGVRRTKRPSTHRNSVHRSKLRS